MKIKIYMETHKTFSGEKISLSGYLLISCSYSGKRMKTHLGIKIDPVYWDKENQRVKDIHPDSAVFNSYLVKITEIAEQSFCFLNESQSPPDPKELREEINKRRPLPLIGFFDAYIEFMEENMYKWTTNTYKKIRTLYKVLREYSLLPGNNLQLHSFDLNNFRAVEEHFIKNSGYANVTSSKYLNIIKWFLSWAIRKKYYFNPALKEFRPSDVPMTEKDKTIVYLNKTELFRIYDLKDLSRKEERIRDVFCFCCFTGLRYTEATSIKKPDIAEGTIRFKEAGSEKSIPLNRYASELLMKYKNTYFKGDTVFPVFSNLTFNKYLRTIALKADLQRLVYYEKDSNMKSAAFPVNQIISSGLARNTFLMTALELGVSEETLARITGSKSSQILRRYKLQLENKDKLEFSKFDNMR